jgi:glycosyltransferase involved in cell wall biosynthesis
MEICVLNPFFHPYSGGTEKVLLEVYRRLAKRHNVTVLSASLDPKGRTMEEDICGIRVIRLRSDYVYIPMMPLPFVNMRSFNRQVEKIGADIYHINNRYECAPNTVRRMKKVGGKVVLTIHNALPKGINTITDGGGLLYDVVSGRKVMHMSDRITGVSKNALTTTLTKKDLRKSSVIFNGVDYRIFKPRSGSDKTVNSVRKSLGIMGKDIMMTNGRLIPQKGHVYLMEAVADLVRSGRDMGMFIIGRGYLQDKLYELAGELGIADRFTIVSNIPESRLPYYYNAATMFALPSLYEPASIALLESLTTALPTVASKVGGIPEMMKDTGFYAAPKSSTALRDKIEYIMENRKRSEQLAQKGRRLMMKEHDWDNISKQYETLFESLV